LEVSMFNSEGYRDPTPYDATSSSIKEGRTWKLLMYIASTFTGDKKRIQSTH